MRVIKAEGIKSNEVFSYDDCEGSILILLVLNVASHIQVIFINSYINITRANIIAGNF